MDLATPDTEGQEQEVMLKIEATSAGEKNTGRTIPKNCGGDYLLPLSISTDKEGVYNSTVKLINATDNSEIEGGALSFCYTVANDGIDKCGVALAPTQAVSDKNVKSSKKSVSKKTKSKN